MQTIRIVIFTILVAITASGANLVPNSSFECGYDRGLIEWGTGNSQAWGNLEFGTGLLTNDSYHGRYAMRMPTGGRLQMRTTGYEPAQAYTMSFYARGAGTLPFGIFQEAALAIASSPPNNAVLTGAWTLYTVTVTTTTNSFLWARFGPAPAGAEIDAIQIEVGSSATAYQPQATIEAGLSIPNTNNTWFLGDSPSFDLNLWNSGSTANIRIGYDVFDLWNSNVLSGSVLAEAAGGTNSTTSVSLAGIGSGWFKITSRIGTINDSGDEIHTVIYPYASNVLASATSWLGGHPHISPFHAHREHLARRNTARSLSPNGIAARWQLVQPSTNTDFVFFDVCFTNWAAEGLDIVCNLTPTDGTWNPWATNMDGTASMNFWSNYCYMVTRRVCVTLGLTNTAVEVFNEAFQTGPFSGPIDASNPTNYATILSYAVWGITNAYPNARIIAIGGSYGDGSWAESVFQNISAGTKAAIYAVSTHVYPQDNSLDPNIGEFPETRFSNPGSWVRKFAGIKPVWNTESGTYDTGPFLGMNGMFPVAYDVHWTPTFEATRSEWMNRQLVATVRILPMALRCIGYGMERYFYYDSRFFNDSSFSGSQPYPSDYMQVDRPCVVSLSVASSLVAKGFGPITNTLLGGYVELYACTNFDGQATVPAWSADRENRILTLTNSHFKVLNCMGNQTQEGALTVKLTRVPQFIVSDGSLTLGQLSNMLAVATSVTVPDVLPPQISIDIAPSGSWSGDSSPVLFKWTAIDDRWTAWNSLTSATNVAYRWKLDAGSWSNYSQSNHVWISSLSAGTHTFYVGAIDAEGNASEKTYRFIPSSSSLTVATNLSVVTLNVGP